jgi:hypothetical protein
MKIMAILILIMACTKGINTPEGVIQAFVQEITKENKSIDNLKNYVTGDFLVYLNDIPAEEKDVFASLDTNKNFKVKFLKSTCAGPENCNITYDMSYDVVDQTGKVQFATQVRKVAEMINLEGQWKISTVTNIKTVHEAKQAIDATAK